MSLQEFAFARSFSHHCHHRHTNSAWRAFSSATTTTPQDQDDDDVSEIDVLGTESDFDFSNDEFPPPPPITERKNVNTPTPNRVNGGGDDDDSNSNPAPPPTTTTERKNVTRTATSRADDENDDNNDDKNSANYEPPEPVKIPQELMDRIEKLEWQGGRMRSAQHGVLHEDPKIDMRLLMENYSVASLASALRDREDVLQQCATLASEGKFDQLQKVLQSFHPRYVIQRRTRRRRLDVCRHLDAGSLEVIRKALMRMPRTVTTAHTQRAGVVIPLCLKNGVPSLLLEKRSPDMRAHPGEVCLPGGMVCSINDTTIVSTCLREMKEEIPGLDMTIVQVLGILRCNWGEVHHLVGVAVTPVVCYLGEVPDDLNHNADEVAKVFTIPLSKLLENSLWVQKEDLAPIFVGGPEIIWGLTGYILERFVKDVILPNHIRKDHHLHHHSLQSV